MAQISLILKALAFGSILVFSASCDWLLAEFSAYSDVEFADIDPASFNDNLIDNVINPYLRKPKNIQFAQYFSGGEHFSNVALKERIISMNGSREVKVAIIRAGGMCQRHNSNLHCVYNKVIWPLDSKTGMQNNDYSKGVCLHYQFKLVGEKGTAKIADYDSFISPFRNYAGYTRKSITDLCQMKGWVDDCKSQFYHLECMDHEPRVRSKKSVVNSTV